MILLNKAAGVTSPSPAIRAATALEFAKEGQNILALAQPMLRVLMTLSGT